VLATVNGTQLGQAPRREPILVNSVWTINALSAGRGIKVWTMRTPRPGSSHVMQRAPAAPPGSASMRMGFRSRVVIVVPSARIATGGGAKQAQTGRRGGLAAPGARLPVNREHDLIFFMR